MIFTPKITADGSFTFFSAEFQEDFHSYYGAKAEAKKKFVESCLLAEKAQTTNSLCLLDICYGLGYNSGAALETIWSVNPQCCVKLIGLEVDKRVPEQAIAHKLIALWSEPVPQLLAELSKSYAIKTERLEAELLIGDARRTIQEVIKLGFKADSIFLDPFSPPKCPQLWTVEFLGLVAQCLKLTGKLATYSCAASVRTALLEGGLQIRATESMGRRSPGTVASFSNNNLPNLSQQEMEHLQTRAAIPYRDPNGCDRAEVIIQRRQTEQENSNLEPTTHWKKRWSQQ
ncbi:MAG: hypothetical protein DSM107014_08235 [Gomphosphaeria aponina SAG 52.96 = DSM 107014]|uniref:MnmC-like methyltransferase domain-containing protein n=1 Tax=Gomphosphaeria aponina SAG 52.96 = DSM 107014 TaxID=1521640 RepID=A0A941JS43_9CHRO|nr:hypothetical protein [Gomphosphaeria aponina SAG 52.96 = DSM 107014]